MHEDEEEYYSARTLGEEHSSLLPAVGDTIVLVGGTLVFWKEVPTHQLIQGMHELSSHIVSVNLIENYEDMPLGPMHNQGLEQNADLKQKHITTQRTLVLIKEEVKNCPISSLLSYIQPFEL